MQERQRVVLIEDSPTQAERVRTLLEADGLEVIHYPDAESAYDAVHTADADLIVLDLNLPGMRGDDFCREMRMNVNMRTVPVLMLTIEGSDAAQLHGLESGADDYLAKTADPDVLRFHVQALLRKSKGVAPILDVEKRFSRARVLAIDDSPTYLYFLANELRSERYLVETADTPEKGLDLIRKTSFDCIFINYELPRLNGAEVCRRIRVMKRDDDSEMVVVMLTSHEDKEHMRSGFDSGADDYIVKSTDISVVKGRVRALLRRKFLVEENRHILNELRARELQAIRARADQEAAELRARVADQLAEKNRELERLNHKLDLANRELDEFAHAAAHDLKEPLRTMTSYIQLLQGRYGNALDDDARQFIRFAVEGSARMGALIEDLLLYARVAKTETECKELVSLDTSLDNALATLSGSIKESKAEIVRAQLPDLCVEAVRMQQLFQNLVGNAIKFRKPGQSPVIRISSDRDGDNWVFAVEDNGIGIDAAHRERVFSAFKRLHNREYAGTGLGLTICKRIVEQYGGEIWVESEPGRGSKFVFTLPASLARLQPLAAGSVAVPNTQSFS
jgi:two-component system NtrC family sensor kinase